MATNNSTDETLGLYKIRVTYACKNPVPDAREDKIYFDKTYLCPGENEKAAWEFWKAVVERPAFDKLNERVPCLIEAVGFHHEGQVEIPGHKITVQKLEQTISG
jgi:hypothetical protein